VAHGGLGKKDNGLTQPPRRIAPGKNDRQERQANRQANTMKQMTRPESLPDGAELVLRIVPMPADANANGDIFGGWIMGQVDIAGAVLAARIARGRLVTVAVNQFIFKQPVSVGDLLSFYARLERVGNTSITVHVEVYAERNPANLQVVKVTEANLTYVAITLDGQPRLIPKD
jgi:acyl-CoA thioesterase YciA